MVVKEQGWVFVTHVEEVKESHGSRDEMGLGFEFGLSSDPGKRGTKAEKKRAKKKQECRGEEQRKVRIRLAISG